VQKSRNYILFIDLCLAAKARALIRQSSRPLRLDDLFNRTHPVFALCRFLQSIEQGIGFTVKFHGIFKSIEIITTLWLEKRKAVTDAHKFRASDCLFLS